MRFILVTLENSSNMIKNYPGENQIFGPYKAILDYYCCSVRQFKQHNKKMFCLIPTSCNMLLALSDILSNSSMQQMPLSLRTKAPLSSTYKIMFWVKFNFSRFIG